MNRLKSATETIGGSQTWKQTFLFDRYGNRNFDPAQTTTLGNCPANICNPAINAANNRIVGQVFDNAGNTTVDAEGRQFFYDGENKQKEVRNAQNQIIGQYLYDGDGKRVKKLAANDTTIFVYDAGGRLSAEYLITAATSQAPTTSYLTNDTLGSPRVTTDATGNVVSRRDFRPYGEEIYRPNQGSDKVRQKFTGYERDNETELDFAQARMFGSGLGRFTSPDPLLASAHRVLPQSWNRYSYVLNDPLNLVDPSGLDWGIRNNSDGTKSLCYLPGSRVCQGYRALPAGIEVNDLYVNGVNVGRARLNGNGSVTLLEPQGEIGFKGNSTLSHKDLSAIRDIGGGVICSITISAICWQTTNSEIAGNVKSATDLVQLAFLIKTLAAAGISAAAAAIIIKKHPDDIARIAAEIIGKGWKWGQCEECADALISAFKKAGIEAKKVKLESAPKSAIIVEKTGKEVGEKGMPHYGVQVGDMIYEMNSKVGIPVKEWASRYLTRDTITQLPVPPVIKEVSRPK